MKFIDKYRLIFTNTFGALIIIFLLGLLFGLSINDRTQTLRHANDRTLRIADFIIKQLERNLTRIDSILISIDYAIEIHPEANQNQSQRIREMLLGIKNQNDYLMDIVIVNQNLEIIHWTADGKVPYVKDRDFALAHMKENPPLFFIGEPKVSRVHKGKWFFGVSRAHRNKEGKVVRIVAAMISLDYIQNVLGGLIGEEYESLEVLNESGNIIAKIPYEEGIIGTNVQMYNSAIKDFLQEISIESPELIKKIKKGYNNRIMGVVTLTNEQAYPGWRSRVGLYIFLGFLIVFVFTMGFYKVSAIQRELTKALFTIQYDLSIAKKLQSNILAGSLLRISDINFSITYKPMAEVGGDFYDIIQLPNGIVRFFIADATGHGVQAALMTMSIFTEYQSVREFEMEPASVLEILNYKYYKRYSMLNTFFTCMILDIDLEHNKIIYAAAGHPEQISIIGDNVQKIKTTGKMLGLISNSFYTNSEIDFSLGDKLVLFTDGAFEQINLKYEEFGEDRLFQLVNTNKHLDAVTLNDQITHGIYKYIQGSIQNDDITIIVLERKPRPSI